MTVLSDDDDKHLHQNNNLFQGSKQLFSLDLQSHVCCPGSSQFSPPSDQADQ